MSVELTQSSLQDDLGDAIAIIGMAGRFPGAQNIDEYWRNIVEGRECIRFFSDSELLDAGVSQDELSNPRYVRGKGYLENAEHFDAAFFGMTARDADILDPQQRMFLQCAWSSMENAGYIPDEYEGLVGVFAGVGIDFYLWKNLMMNSKVHSHYSEFQIIVNNDKDYLATRLSHKLNLRGPSVVVQSACSTALVAVHLACQSLRTYQCDLALGGASFLQVPRIAGYTYREGHILSPDGHCRAFDKGASGTNFGDGVGTVVLKRLEDAIEDHDHIYAVIRSVAVTNDGADKIGYTAPSISGQSQAITMAHSFAGITPDTIGYIETHGTGTPLGDPIELAGLKEAFKSTTRPGKYCAIGSVKSNIGHLDVAAGVAGLIKTALCLYHGTIPASINYSEPNPELGIDDGPFTVNTVTRPWEPLIGGNGQSLPRRAGLSSFGMGGTNAHAVIEEFERPVPTPSTKPAYILPISAMTVESRDEYTTKLADYFAGLDSASLSDVSYTLWATRKRFDVRRYVVCEDAGSAVARLNDVPAIFTGSAHAGSDEVEPVFMFSGQGGQYPGMGKHLYDHHPVFRKEVDRCAEIVLQKFGFDIREIMFVSLDGEDEPALYQTEYTQPALFTIEYAMAQTWMNLGVRPSALIGHSIGEYPAACVAGVFSLEDAITLVCHRGRLMQSMKPGSMMAVKLPEHDLLPYLNNSITIGVINTSSMCVVSGEDDAIASLDQQLQSEKVSTRMLHTSHAFHSPMMDPMLDEFEHIAATVTYHEPRIPLISNVTGTWLSPDEAMDPKYWTKHVRNTVRYADGIHTLFEAQHPLYLEMGPGNTLATITQQQASNRSEKITTVPSLPHPKQDIPDYSMWLAAAGKMWAANVSFEWELLFDGEEPHRIPLPTYQFMPERHWIDPDITTMSGGAVSGAADREGDRATNTVAVPEAPHSLKDQVRAIWEDMFGTEDIGDDDDFFDLGGDSIWASQLINRINDHYRSALPLNTIFKVSTVRTLTEFMESEGISTGEQPVEEVSPSVIETAQSDTSGHLSLPQQRLWFLSTFAPESPAFNLVISYELNGALNTDILRDSIGDIVNRHAMLRTRYIEHDGIPESIVEPTVLIDIDMYDLSEYDRNEANEKMTAIIREYNLVPYDIVHGPLFRCQLFTLAPDEHVLSFMVHHISFDGWSLGVFLTELGVFYQARLDGAKPNLKPLSVQYADFAAWQQDTFLTKDLSADREYWINKLKDAPPVLNMPLDKPRPSMPANTGGLVDFILPESLTQRLKELCARERVTLFTLLQTVFKVLIYRYTGQTDILVGSPVANRTRSVDEQLIGLFINMIVLRSDFSGDLTFSELLAQEQKNVYEALSHSEYPFERIIDDLKLKRDITVHPIYQIMFAYQNFAMPTVSAGPLSMRNIVLDRGASQLDLWLFMYEEGNTIRGAFEFDDELFDQATIERMVEQLEVLLACVADNPTQNMKYMDFLPAQEIQDVVHTWNMTHTPYPETLSIIDLVEQQIERSPDSTAIVCGNNAISYAELGQRSNVIANMLLENSVASEELITICMPRSINMIACVLGVLKAGCAYLPIDHKYPKDRIDFILSDAGSNIVLTTSEYEGLFTASGSTVLRITPSDPIDGEVTQPLREHNPHHRAYVIYTSGSTGTPKGVVIENTSVVNLLNSLRRKPGMEQVDTLLAVTSLTFDVSIVDLFLPLICGGKTVVATEDQVADGVALLELINTHGITVMPATPVTWRIMVDAGWSNTPGLKAFCAGEAISEDLAKLILDTGTQLWNIYGPTEATVYASQDEVTDYLESSVIGYPLDNVQLYVLDRERSIVPIGIPGELYIGGVGLAREYLNRPDLTDNAFMLTDINGEQKRIYKTGDLVKRLPDGRIKFMGRIDNQVKVRGYRIELGEIEVRLDEHPLLRNVAVIAREFDDGEKRLVAYYTCDNSITIGANELKGHLREKLPEYMIPSFFIQIESMPLTVSGKIDRKSLPDVSLIQNKSSIGVDEQLTTVQSELKDIWQEVLGHGNISIRDSFFDIGGDSLMAARLFALIGKRLGMQIPLASLFRHPTIDGIARIIESGQVTSRWKSLVPIRTQGSKPALFLVHGAEGNILIYRELEHHIPDGHPVYGIQSPGLIDPAMNTLSFEEMAALYITEIKTVQPEGPYHLGGYCSGGVIVYEMARQLRQNGDEVGLIALLETYNITTIAYPPPPAEQAIIELQNVWFHMKSLVNATQHNSGWDFLQKKGKTQLMRVKTKAHILLSKFRGGNDGQDEVSYPHIAVTKTNHAAQIAYEPKKFDGKIVLFRPKTYYKGSEDPHYGWKDLVTGELIVHVLHAYPHTSLSEPYVTELGGYISHYLEEYSESV